MIKHAMRDLKSLAEYVNRGMDMDYQMDGSGDCSSMIHSSWERWHQEKVDRILKAYNLTREQVVETARQYCNKELELGPKTIKLQWNKRDPGTMKPKDSSDCYYSDLAYFNF